MRKVNEFTEKLNFLRIQSQVMEMMMMTRRRKIRKKTKKIRKRKKRLMTRNNECQCQNSGRKYYCCLCTYKCSYVLRKARYIYLYLVIARNMYLDMIFNNFQILYADIIANIFQIRPFQWYFLDNQILCREPLLDNKCFRRRVKIQYFKQS